MPPSAPAACETGQQASNDNSYRWRKRDPASVPSEFMGDAFSAELVKHPYDYFKCFFDDQLMQHIVEQTNLYYTQKLLEGGKDSNFSNTTAGEIEQYLGILMFMGVFPHPQYRMYWSKSTPFPKIVNTMSVNRFDLLKRYLHFNDNSTMNTNASKQDKLFKVRPVIESIRSKCRSLEPEEFNSIDEQMIPSKHHSSLKQYMPKKPHKWGYKVFTRCGASGMIYDFEVYFGKGTEQNSKLGVTGDLVIRLCEMLPRNKNFKVYFDNFFTSLPLLKVLKREGILALGTIRSNRLGGAQKLLETDKSLKTRGRGNYDWRVDASSNITTIKWNDNNIVSLASNFIGPEEGEEIRRWSSKDKAYINVTCPRMVREYNSFMGGVDLADMLLALYRIPMRSKKWYIPIFFYLLKTAITNGWLLYRRHCTIEKEKAMPLLEFQLQIAEDLLKAGKLESCTPKRGRPSTSNIEPKKKSKTSAAAPVPTGAARFDCLDHFPRFDEKQHRCRLCSKGFTHVKCSKCQIYLCLQKQRNCFTDFHKK